MSLTSCGSWNSSTFVSESTDYIIESKHKVPEGIIGHYHWSLTVNTIIIGHLQSTPLSLVTYSQHHYQWSFTVNTIINTKASTSLKRTRALKIARIIHSMNYHNLNGKKSTTKNVTII